MTTLVLGASGATGKQLVAQLLLRQQTVKVIVRSPDKLPESWKNDERVTIIHAVVSDMSETDMVEYLKNCQAVASCLGHNLTWRGVYGKPRRLVTDAVKLICGAIKKRASETRPVRFVLMNTTGNRNRDINEPRSFGERVVIGLLRLLLPPHVDNEMAADYLRTKIGQKDNYIEWIAVRPDSLIDEDKVTEYNAVPSPTRSPIFDAGKTSRINVGDFMAELITNEETWKQWKGKMPVIYNKQ